GGSAYPVDRLSAPIQVKHVFHWLVFSIAGNTEHRYVDRLPTGARQAQQRTMHFASWRLTWRPALAAFPLEPAHLHANNGGDPRPFPGRGMTDLALPLRHC